MAENLKSLCDLLASRFQSNTGLRLFIRKLPDGETLERSIGGDHLPRMGLADDTVTVLERHNAIDVTLFNALIREFPVYHHEIRGVARDCGVIEPLAQAPSGAEDEEHHSGVMLDNFLLQDIAYLLDRGLPGGMSARIDIDPTRETHEYHRFPAGVVTIHSLFSFISELVLRDRLWLDQDYADTWQKIAGSVDALAESDILRVKKMTQNWSRFKAARQVFLDELCVTKALRTNQARAEAEYALTRSSTDSVHSIVVWGTAGNIARSETLGLPYSPHPIRRHFLAQTTFAAADATVEVMGWVQRERGRLFERVDAGRRRRSAQVILPAVAALVIAEARDTSQLISVALQMRERFAPLREWLAVHQHALYIEDPNELQQCSRFLQGLESTLNTSATLADYGRTCVDLCAQLFANSVLIDHRLDAAIQLGQLVFAPKGQALTRDLLRKLDSSPSQTEDIMRSFDALSPVPPR